MTEANRLTHYGLLVTAFLRVNTMYAAVLPQSHRLFVTAFLRVNTILPSRGTQMKRLLVTAFLRINTIVLDLIIRLV